MNGHDILILRELAEEVREAASQPRMAELREKWIAHNDLNSKEPMILFDERLINQKEILPESALQCEDEEARRVERSLRMRLFHRDYVPDDLPISADFCVNFAVEEHGWRELTKSRVASGEEGTLHSYIPVPVLQEPERIRELRHSTFSVDREKTVSEIAKWENIFGDILNVRLRGGYYWTLGMTWDFLRLTGMEEFLVLPYDDPDVFHEIMRFLRDEIFLQLDFLEKEKLFTLNNGNDYIGSGGCGFTKSLPAEDYSGNVRTKDQWCLLESQESVSMSPKMFRDYIFPYQLEISKRFGLTYYGCCEPVHDRYETIAQIQNLRTLSVSPWCDMPQLADKLDRELVLACKPSPACIANGFEEEALKQHVLSASDAFKGHTIEYVMKDVHTIGGDISRIRRWIELVWNTMQ